MSKAKSVIPGISVGIRNLPPSAGQMQIGRPYAITCSIPHIKLPLLAGAISHSLTEGRKVMLVCGLHLEELIFALRVHGIDARKEISRGHLTVLRQSEHQDRNLLRYGADRFVDELDYFGVTRDSLIVIAPAHGLLSSQDIRLANQQAQVYSRWFRDNRATGLFLFTESGATQRQLQLASLDGWFAGLANLCSDGLRLDWEVEHWRTPEGSLINREYGIVTDAGTGLLSADGGEESARNQHMLTAPDHGMVYATQSSISDAKGLPSNWRIVEQQNELLQVAESAVAASFVLEPDAAQNIERIAQLIHGLRQRGGSGIKIVLRERSQRLRYNHEMMLMRLGANAVIDASLSFSRFLAVIDSLREQTFTREIPKEFDSAMLAAMPPASGGYLQPDEFCVAVRESTARGADLGLRSALLRLTLNPQLSHLDALKQIHLNRSGDVFTADDSSVYIFLFACRAPDIDTVLDLIIEDPLPDVFEGQVRWLDNDAIDAAMDDLRLKLRQIAVTDYTSVLAPSRTKALALSENSAPAQVQTTVHPTPPPALKPSASPTRSITRAPFMLRSPT